jgi:nucleotide-binding universal stress UspA family protein
VPLDGSQVAEDALAPARAIVAATQAHLVLVQGVPFTVASHQQEVTAHAAVTEAQRYVRTVAEHLEREGITARPEVLPGTPEQAILFAAQVHHADLIVISTHGHSTLRHVFAGSVAEAVLRHAECPVLITRPGHKIPAGERSARRILIPLDGSPLSEAALAYVTSEQLAAGAHVILLRVVERPSLSGASLITGQLSDDYFVYADAQVAKGQEAAEHYLSALGERYLQSVEWEKQVIVGYAVEDIVHCAKELRADLIVMASEGRHGFERLLYGSVAGRVLRHAPMPVLVVHDVSSQ